MVGPVDRENHYRCAAMFHPLRQQISRLLADRAELAADDLAVKLGRPHGQIGYHLRILVKRRVLRVVPRRPPGSPLYRWSDEASWAREMLLEEDD